MSKDGSLWIRWFHRHDTHLLQVLVLLDLLPLLRLFLFRENVLLTHSNLEALLQSAPLAETSIRKVHLALLVVWTLEITLHKEKPNVKLDRRKYFLNNY